MTSAAAQARIDERRTPARAWVVALAVCAIYVCVLLATKPGDYSDTLNYGKHIAQHYANPPEPAGDPFFDFGHLLWKLLGYVCWVPLRAPLRALFGGNEILSASAVLVALSMIAGGIGAVFLSLLIRRATRRPDIAVLATAAYLGTNALLYWTQTGMAYVPGIACQIVALYTIQRALDEGRFTFRAGLVSGAVLGLSVLFWFPYILAAGGVLAYALLCDAPAPQADWRVRVSGAAGMAVGAAMVTLGVYACVIAATHPTSVQQVAEWATRSRYGKKPDRGLVRLLGGVPRGFIDLSTVNTAFKRLLFEQRGFAVVEMLRLGVWKIPLVYGFLAATVVALWRTAWGRRHLACLSVVALPLVYFAAFLFEATPPERYLAAFPLLFLSLARLFADPRSPKWALRTIAASLAIAVVVNIGAMARTRADSFPPEAASRAESVAQHISPADAVVLMSHREDALRFVAAHPFGAVAAKTQYRYYVALPWGLGTAVGWRQQFSAHALSVWKAGGQVWLSRRLLAPKADPALWVEGDIPGLTWPQVNGFFRQLELGPSFGGSDGFTAVARTAKNESLLQSLAETENGG